MLSLFGVYIIGNKIAVKKIIGNKLTFLQRGKKTEVNPKMKFK